MFYELHFHSKCHALTHADVMLLTFKGSFELRHKAVESPEAKHYFKKQNAFSLLDGPVKPFD